MSLKKRLFNNGLAYILQKGVRVLEQLFLVPFFISAWGAAYYGEWLTLTIIPSVIAFSDLGFGTSAANSFVLSYAAGDKKKAADINKTGMYIITIMVLIAIFISVVTIFSLNYFNVFDKSLINSDDAIIAVSVLITAYLLNFYNQLIESYFRAAQKAALSINLLTIKASANLGVGLFVLLLDYGVVAFAFSQLAVAVIFNGCYWILGKQALGLFKTHRGQKDKYILRDITRKGLGYLMFPAWQAIYFQGTTFAVRIILGPEAVAVFNTVRTLSRSVNQLLNIVSSSIFPELQYEIGEGNIEKAQKIYRFSIVSSFIIAFIGVIFLAIFGLWFYEIWTHNELHVPQLMWYIFVLGILFHAFWWSSEPVFRAKNEPYKFAVAGISSASLSVLLTFIFSKYFGLTGAAMGALALDVMMAIIIMPLSATMLNLKLKDILSHAFSDMQQLYVNVKSKFKLS
ncbi:lipopolysaccharide biosynthesis protein [Zobellia amurskyensis]|uniref:Lipopolysaccharide biosynthesis protein n=1 Tax=Zobellia amurskyensis TaxID=248905 RepID=A0A7X2ZSH5_9FLAO|nr:lipopolysaccharide biosynthesis protein [Zobellia amurskyensis]MUH35591.1 lipopolysaccharide biosynthesis protein [Zobellia amurskyensis]